MSQRGFSFDLEGVAPAVAQAHGRPRGNTSRALATFPVARVGAPAGQETQDKGSWSWPWAALPLAIHRLLNGGKSGIVDVSEQWFAVFLYETDRVVRVSMWIGGALLASFVAAVDFPEAVLQDEFTWVVLICLYVGIYLNVTSALVGRFTRIDTTFTIEEVAARSELRLPLLLLNYQSFGLDRVDGWFAALITIITHLIGAGAWGVALYVSAIRMFDQNPYRWAYTFAWASFGGAGLLNALASSVSFADAREVTSKTSSDLNSGESFRVAVIQLKCFWVLTVCVPLVVSFVLYAHAEV